jgi:DNA mismatch endonuclease (patch repair protein)
MKRGCALLPPDRLTRRRMKATRRSGTDIELALRCALSKHGVRYRLNVREEGTAIDIAFPGVQLAVFCDGCFWHGCRIHGTQSKRNCDWWREKIAANVERDKRLRRKLVKAGWTVVRVWGHESAATASARIVAKLRELKRCRG